MPNRTYNMQRLIVSVLAAVMLAPFLSSAQEISDEQKQTFLPKIQKILKDYEAISQFSTDGSTIDNKLIAQFPGLFAPKIKYGIYNDLALNKGSSLDNPSEYTNFVKEFYPQGLDVTLDMERVSIVGGTLRKGTYTIVAKVSKRVAGIYARQNIRRATMALYFYFTAPEVTEGIPDFKISSIVSTDRYLALTDSRGKSGLYLGVAGIYTQSQIFSSAVYSSEKWAPAMGSSITPAANLTIMLARGFGIGTGFRMSSYLSNFTLNQYNGTSTQTVSDIDGESYYPVLSVPQLTEKNTIESYDFPVYFHFLMGRSKLRFYLNMGVVFTLVNKAYYTLEGTATKAGNYSYNYNGTTYTYTLEDISEYGFGTTSYKADTQYEMKLPGNALAGYGALGFKIMATPRFNIHFGATINYGLTDLELSKKRYDFDFTSTLGKEVGPTVLQALGVEFGLNFRLF